VCERDRESVIKNAQFMSKNSGLSSEMKKCQFDLLFFRRDTQQPISVIRIWVSLKVVH